VCKYRSSYIAHSIHCGVGYVTIARGWCFHIPANACCSLLVAGVMVAMVRCLTVVLSNGLHQCQLFVVISSTNAREITVVLLRVFQRHWWRLFVLADGLMMAIIYLNFGLECFQ
jgi:hypothetical protein